MTPVSDEDVESITGAFWRPDLDMFRALLEATARDGGGDLAELGVMYGRSAVLMGAYRSRDETFTVVDLFEDQADDSSNNQENLSSYPGLTRRAFEENYRRLIPTLPKVVQGPSESIVDHARSNTHRFVHVDASHLYDHVEADIAAARKLLRDSGILVLDDFRAEHTPGVAAAAWRAVAIDELHPFAITPFKMYATWGDPEPYRMVAERTAALAGVAHEVQTINGVRLSRLGVVPQTPHRLKSYVPPALWPAMARARREIARLRDRR